MYSVASMDYFCYYTTNSCLSKSFYLMNRFRISTSERLYSRAASPVAGSDFLDTIVTLAQGSTKSSTVMTLPDGMAFVFTAYGLTSTQSLTFSKCLMVSGSFPSSNYCTDFNGGSRSGSVNDTPLYTQTGTLFSLTQKMNVVIITIPGTYKIDDELELIQNGSVVVTVTTINSRGSLPYGFTYGGF